jgi:hypothetical protein
VVTPQHRREPCHHRNERQPSVSTLRFGEVAGLRHDRVHLARDIPVLQAALVLFGLHLLYQQ